MPNIDVDGYQIGFVMADVKHEPAHVHVSKGGKSVKYWLEPISMARGTNKGFSGHELTKIERILTDKYTMLINNWNRAKGSYKP